VDLNHRPALGSLEELWVHIEPFLPKTIVEKRVHAIIVYEDSKL